MSQKSNHRTNIGNAVKKAIRHLRESKGSSFADIKKYLASVYQTNRVHMPDSTSLKKYLKNAVDKGILLKLDNGNYKIKENARRKKSNRSSSLDKKPRSGSRSKKRSDEIRRTVSCSKKPGRPRIAKQAMVSEKKIKRKSAQSSMPAKKKHRPLTEKRAVTPKKTDKQKTKKGTSLSDYSDEPDYEDSDTEDRNEILDEIPHSLSGSKKAGRQSSAKQAMGSEKINLTKTKRASPSPMPVKKKQAPPVKKRAVTSKKMNKLRKRDLSLSDYEDSDIEDHMEFSSEIQRSLSGNKKPGRPSSAKQAKGSDKVDLRNTKEKSSPSSMPVKKKQTPPVKKRAVTSEKVNKLRKRDLSLSDYEDSDIEGNMEFSGEIQRSLSGNKKPRRASSAKQAKGSDKVDLRNTKEKHSPSPMQVKKKQTPPVKKRAVTSEKVNKLRKRDLSLSDYEDSDIESHMEFSGEIQRSLSGNKRPGRPSSAKQAKGSDKVDLRNTKEKPSPSLVPVKKKQSPPAKKRAVTKDKRKEKEALSLFDYSDEPDYETSDVGSREEFSGEMSHSLSGSKKYKNTTKMIPSPRSIPDKKKKAPPAKKRAVKPKKVDKRKKKKGLQR